MKIRWKGILATLTVSMLASCATPTPSQQMTNVQNDLNSSQREALETQFPRLIAESQAALKKGQKALEEGEPGESELYASIANSKYQAAANLSRSSEINNQRAALEDALASLKEEVDFLAREAEELKRFKELDARFKDATASLDQYEGREGEARQSLALARRKQATAIREGAPKFAEEAYKEGEVLAESALSSLERGDFESTIDLSGQATTAFEEAVANSKDNAIAQRRREAEREKQRKTDTERRNEALSLIEQAVEMKSAALAEGADQKQPNLFQQGDFLLSRAEMAVEDERFEQAGQSARKSASSFEEAVKSRAQEAPEQRDRAVAQRSDREAEARGRSAESQSSQRSSASRDDVLRFLTLAQMQRAEALGRGEDEMCPNAFQEFEAVLSIAEQRMQSGDQFYALEHAIRAQERLRICTRIGPQTRQPNRQALRGQAPTQRTDSTPGTGESQAQTDRTRSTGASASSDKAAEQELSPVAKAARDRAIQAMTEADLALARSQARGTQQSVLSRASSLKDTAEKSFEDEDYARATVYADFVVEALAPKEDASTSKDKSAQAEARASTQKEKGTERSEGAAKTDENAASQCPENRSLASYLEDQSRNRKYASEARGDTSWKPSSSLEAAIALDEEGRCERAREFYQRAADELFAQREKDEPKAEKPEDDERKTSRDQQPDTRRSRTVTRRAPQDTARDDSARRSQSSDGDEATRQRALQSLAESQRKLASLDAKSTSPALKVSTRLVKRSGDAFESGRFSEAYMLSEQAIGAMESISDERQTGTSSGEWRGAYQQVLDALIARDRAQTLVNQNTRQVFDRGVSFLKRARKAWSSKDYGAAQRFARASLEDFDEVQQNADEAQKEAVRQKAAQKEQEQRAEAARQQESKQESRQRATSALRNAEVKFEMCEEKHCRKRDSRKYLTGTETLEDARDAMDAQAYGEAERLAEKASRHFEEALNVRLDLEPATSEHLKIVEGEIVLSPRIKFELGSTSVSQASMESIRALADYLSANKRVLESVSIIGHTDSKGNAENNRALSRDRAQSVADTLKSLGVDSSLLKINGMGEAQPIATNDTADGRARNRRVEIRYILHSE